MPRDPRDRCSIGWNDRYGTTWSGNLPRHKTKECVEDAIDLPTIQAEFPWVGIEDFHFYHFKCPYATEASIHLRRDVSRSSLTYWQHINVANEAAAHAATSGIMIKYNRGSKYGWLCVDPECPYYKGTVSGSTGGIPYFHF